MEDRLDQRSLPRRTSGIDDVLFERPGNFQCTSGQTEDHLLEGELALPDEVDAHGILTDGVVVVAGDTDSTLVVEAPHDLLLGGTPHQGAKFTLEPEVQGPGLELEPDLFLVERRVDQDERALNEREREAVDGLEHDTLGVEGFVRALHPGELEVDELAFDGVDVLDVRAHRREPCELLEFGRTQAVFGHGLGHECHPRCECLCSKPMRIYC